MEMSGREGEESRRAAYLRERVSTYALTIWDRATSVRIPYTRTRRIFAAERSIREETTQVSRSIRRAILYL